MLLTFFQIPPTMTKSYFDDAISPIGGIHVHPTPTLGANSGDRRAVEIESLKIRCRTAPPRRTQSQDLRLVLPLLWLSDPEREKNIFFREGAGGFLVVDLILLSGAIRSARKNYFDP